jgi:predicted AlkP superfamily pyrophosphatase or phosphodiesterase
MKTRLSILSIFAVAVWVSQVTGAAAGKVKPLTVLISIDGFKPGYMRRGSSPTLDALASNGVFADGLLPSFPSLTFPNHFTLVTGLFPDHHGIVNNTIFDPAIPGPPFALHARDVLANPAWWNEGTPLWVTLRRNGKRTSTLFWPGSDVVIQGVQPDDWLPYDDAMTSAERVEKLLSWLDRAESLRADFATLYFSEVDSYGHQFGPDSPEIAEAVKRVDTAIKRFMDGLDRLGLLDATDFVIVSDHGMAVAERSHVIDLKSLLAGLGTAKIRWIGPLAGFAIGAGERDASLSSLAGESHMTCWPKAAIPERFHFGAHRRIPDVVCLAQIGWFIASDPERPFSRGEHGYDPSEPDMWGLFLAAGPRINRQHLGLIDNVNVYTLLCRLTGVTPERNDGDDGPSRIVVR